MRPREVPRDGGARWDALATALRRPPHPSAATIRVPGGRLWSLPAGAAAVARIAATPAPGAVLDVGAVWAASPALVDELVEGGFPRDRVAWLPPAIRDGDVGPGGGGILALLPAHELDAAAALLDALGAVTGVPVRLLPNVASPALAALVAERLPSAELLRPTSDERVVRGLAAGSDAVCGADGDAFERRLLIAAGAGAAVVAPAGGPAAAVLGDGAAAPTTEAPVMRAAIERALADAEDRDRRAALVRQVCNPSGQSPRLRELVALLGSTRPAPELAPPRAAAALH